MIYLNFVLEFCLYSLFQDWLDRTLQFEADAKEILDEEVPDSKRLEKLYDAGVNLDIDLPEIPQLSQVSPNLVFNLDVFYLLFR